MTVLKWVFIVLGCIVVLAVAGGIGTYFWARTVEPVKLTEADLQIGGPYPAEDRQRVLDICNKKINPNPQADDRCGCLAERAGKDFSRFQRLAFIATFSGDARGFVALTKGLLDSGIPQSRIDELQKNSKSQIDEAVKVCHVKQ